MSLIELLIILLLVGLVFVFVVPVNQARTSQKRVNDAIQLMTSIGEKAEAFKNNPDNGYYPDISQLNLATPIDTTFFSYEIVMDDSTMVAKTQPAFGKKGNYLVYNLASKQFTVGNPKDEADAVSKKYINENWLP
jgi:type II secretory pathway pseudopilin PulG